MGSHPDFDGEALALGQEGAHVGQQSAPRSHQRLLLLARQLHLFLLPPKPPFSPTFMQDALYQKIW